MLNFFRVTLVVVLLLLCYSNAYCGPITVGQIEYLSNAPKSVDPASPNYIGESNQIRLFSLGTFVVPVNQSIPIDISAFGTYINGYAGNSATQLASGTRFDLYMLHYDPVGTTPTYAQGAIQFDTPILGFAFRDNTLNAIDRILGLGSTSSVAGRGQEIGPTPDAVYDGIIWPNDRQVEVHYRAGPVFDDDYIFTVSKITVPPQQPPDVIDPPPAIPTPPTAVPEPSSGLLLAVAVAAIGLTRNATRWSKRMALGI